MSLREVLAERGSLNRQGRRFPVQRAGSYCDVTFILMAPETHGARGQRANSGSLST